MLRRVVVAILCLGGGAARADETHYISAGASWEYTVRLTGAAGPMAWAGPATAPLGPRPGTGKTAITVVTPIADGNQGHVAALTVRKTFRVGAEMAQVDALELRVRYQDALVARLNGVEVARANLGVGAGADEPSEHSRGPEWQAFFVPAAGVLHAGDNLLEVEVRPTAKRKVPVIDVELTGTTARIVRGPMLQWVTAERATLVFDTDLALEAEVRWGHTPGRYDRVASSGGTHHVVEMAGLAADQAIHYQVALGANATPDVTFHTAPWPTDIVRFAMYADVTEGHEVHAQIVRSIIAEALDFVVTAGDLVARGGDQGDWQRFFAVGAPLFERFPMYPAVGNHELGGEGRIEDEFVLPDRPRDTPPGAAWYSFDVGAVHMIMLDSNNYNDERQLTWLKLDLSLARANHARAIFAVAHQGPFSRGPHGGNSTAAGRYVPLLQQFHATAFLSGHDHLFQRGEVGGLDYFVSGGGGSSLYKQACGIDHKPACTPDGMASLISAHHYLWIEVYRDYVTVCPKRPDGAPLEGCTKIKL